MADLEWHQGAELPTLDIWWTDHTGQLVDLSGADTIEVRIGQLGEPAVLVKTTGITAGAGSGTEDDGTPNLSVQWAVDDLDLAPGMYRVTVTATFAGLRRKMVTPLRVLDIVGQPAN